MTWNVKPGDLVVCVKRTPWRNGWGKFKGAQLPYGTICTVNGIETPLGAAFTYLALEGWSPDIWLADCFRPVAKPSIEGLRLLLTKPLVTA